MNRTFRVLLTVLGCACAAVTVLAQVEGPPTLQASGILPPELVSGPNHRVQERVVNDGYLNIYTIESPWGEVRAASTAQLRQYVDELNAVARMETVSKSDEFRRGIREKAGDVVRGAGDLVNDPVGSVAGAASGVAALFGRAGEAVTGGGARSDAEGSRLADATGFASTKRQYAKEFGVDVYSRNPVLQQHLDDLVGAGYAGTMTMSALLMAVPGGAGAAVSVTGGSETLKNIAQDLPPAELRKRNRARLEAMGVATDIADLFIANSVFTPREQTVIVDALDSMQGVADRSAFVKFAVLTENADLAYFRERQAGMYANYHRTAGPFARFVPLGRTAAAISKDGTLVFNAPLDYLAWTPQLAEFAQAVTGTVNEIQGVREKHLRVAGSVSPAAKKGLEELGWKVFEKADT